MISCTAGVCPRAFPEQGRAGGQQEAIPSGEPGRGPQRAGRAAGEPWHRSHAPQEQGRESFAAKPFILCQLLAGLGTVKAN